MATIPCQNEEIVAGLGITPEQCENSALTISPEGRKYSGAEAITVATGVALDLPVHLEIGKVPLLGRLADSVYAWIARNRHRLPGRQNPLNGN